MGLDHFEAVADLEREAGELCAIFATIALKVADRLDQEKRIRLAKPRRNGENGP